MSLNAWFARANARYAENSWYMTRTKGGQSATLDQFIPSPGFLDKVSFSQKGGLLLRDDLIVQMFRACFSRALLTVSRALLVGFVCKHDFSRLDVGHVNARILV
jgi:hypothetical protein